MRIPSLETFSRFIQRLALIHLAVIMHIFSIRELQLENQEFKLNTIVLCSAAYFSGILLLLKRTHTVWVDQSSLKVKIYQVILIVFCLTIQALLIPYTVIIINIIIKFLYSSIA
jgi:hypothetical protein